MKWMKRLNIGRLLVMEKKINIFSASDVQKNLSFLDTKINEIYMETNKKIIHVESQINMLCAKIDRVVNRFK